MSDDKNNVGSQDRARENARDAYREALEKWED